MILFILLILLHRYRQAATYYALTQISFEEVALKFIQVKERESLKMFLLKKMVNLKQQARFFFGKKFDFKALSQW